MNNHIPVLLEEVMAGLAIKKEGCYIDGTFGRGGHSEAILLQLGAQGRILAIDKDPQAIAAGQQKFAGDARIKFCQGSFTQMGEFADTFFNKPVDGILLDLGVSSPQLDDPDRGFSFMGNGPLNMRMDAGQKQTAADWLNRAKAEEIAQVLWQYGEERFSRRIAQAIVQERVAQPFLQTKQLADLIAKVVPKREPHKHPATRSFQSIRIFINQELEDLQKGLHTALDLLAVPGRLAVISFHSLEDRIVKQYMNTQAKGDEALRKLPLSLEQLGIRLRLIGKAIKPSEKEIARNGRARSAILRIGERYR
jgi:16S rRNA (cytosine1402-N4)-methyltransferase